MYSINLTSWRIGTIAGVSRACAACGGDYRFVRVARRRGNEEGWSSQRPASIRAVLATARYARGDVMAPRLRQQ